MKKYIIPLITAVTITMMITLGLEIFINDEIRWSNDPITKQLNISDEGYNFYREIDANVTYNKEENEILISAPTRVIRVLRFDSDYTFESYDKKNKQDIISFEGSHVQVTTPFEDVYNLVYYCPIDINNKENSYGIVTQYKTNDED